MSKNVVTFKCIDCGKERTGKPSSFNKPADEYRCRSCTGKNRFKNFQTTKTRIVCIDCGKERIVYPSEIKKLKNKENYRCHECFMKRMPQNPSWREKHNKLIMEARKDPKWLEKNKKQWEILFQTPSFIENRLSSASGQGFWYGHPILSRERKYCELWNKDLWVRIDAAYDYRSIISGKDKFDNGNRHLNRHHLYWQPKACCVWDEDVGGYYAWILNNGKKVKYYINGDPNKFVLLTDKEHGVIKGNKERDRIWWIKYLENLVEQRAAKEGKKCYLSPEEYEVYKVEHADIIAKYNKKSTQTI